MRLSAGGTPEFGEGIEFESQTWMTCGHYAVRRELVLIAQVTGKAKVRALLYFLSWIKTSRNAICMADRRHVVVRG